MPKTLVFLHGLESGPHGSKYHTLLGLGLGEVIAPDCTGIMDVPTRLAIIETALGEHTELVLVGSSFGGLMALAYAASHPEQVAGLVLCAPAVHRPDIMEPPGVANGLPVRVLHGDHDDIVPLDAVQGWTSRHSLTLRIVADGHRLQDSHGVMGELVREIWAAG